MDLIKNKPTIRISKPVPTTPVAEVLPAKEKPQMITMSASPRPGDARVLLSWEAREFHHYEKTQNWYITLGVLVALGVTFAIFSKSFITAATFFMIGIIVVIYAQKKPGKATFTIYDRGIENNNKYYPFTQLKDFWIVYRPPEVATLNFQPQRGLFEIKVELENQDPAHVRSILEQYLTEDKERQEDFTDALARRLKF